VRSRDLLKMTNRISYQMVLPMGCFVSLKSKSGYTSEIRDREYVNGGDKWCQMAARKCTSRVKKKRALKPGVIFVF